MKKIIFGCRFVSFLMVLILVVHWKILAIPFQLMFHQPAISNGWLVYFIVTSMLFVILNLMAAVGLYFLRKWSFNVSYLAIIFSTYPIGISYVPFLSKFLLPQAPPILMILINLIIFSYVIYLHVLCRKVDRLLPPRTVECTFPN